MIRTSSLLLVVSVFLAGCADKPVEPEPQPEMANAEASPPPDCFRPIKRVPPKYPAAAVRDKIEGRVLLEAIVTRDGRVTNVKVIAAEPPGLFDDAAIASFRQWQYPPRRPGDPDCPGPVQMALEFKL
jgi:protein TonB